MSEEEQKENVRKILEMAKGLIAADKKDALQCGDIGKAVGIASREGQIEHFFQKKGITLE